MTLLTVAASFAERGLGERVRWTRGLQTDVLGPRAHRAHLEQRPHHMLLLVRRADVQRWFSVVVSAEHSEQSLTTTACVTYVHKYASKPHCVVYARLHCPAKWHAQARMLSRALPMDVVRVIGGHICEHAAVMLQKRIRGAAVRFAWGVPCLCDINGNLVYM